MNTCNSLVSSSNLHRVGIRNISDYSPFGVLLKERTVESEFFRRGFNGMETDPEVKGNGNSYDFGSRMLDARIGRWLTLDHLKNQYSNLSPYNYSGNSPITFVDVDGQKIIWPADKEEKKKFKAAIKELKGSEIFKQMFKELEKSETLIPLHLYTMDAKSTEIKKRAIGFYDPSDGSVNWSGAGSSKLPLAQELFHAYQKIEENKEIYSGVTATDREAEGEIATYYIAEELNPDNRDFQPMGGYNQEFVEDPETGKSKMLITPLPILKYGPELTKEEIKSDDFNEAFQEYKEAFVKYNKAEEYEVDGKVVNKQPASYTGKTSEKKAAGLEKIIQNK